MSAESDFWDLFTYDSGSDRWDLAPHLEPMSVLVVCLAKIKDDRAAVAAALADAGVELPDTVEVIRSRAEETGVTMQVRLMADGKVEIWLDEGRPATEVAAMLRDIAAGFESNPRRVG